MQQQQQQQQLYGSSAATPQEKQELKSSSWRHPHLAIPSNWTLAGAHSFLPSSWSFDPDHATYHDSLHNIRLAWNSRSHRKGIPAMPVVAEEEEKEGKAWTVRRQRVRWVGCDVWDISWWVAILFTLGSVFWCINAVLFFCFFTRTSPAYTNTEAATAYVGGSLFLVGAYLGWVEALNPAREADFGWEIDELTRTLIEPPRAIRSIGLHRHHFGHHAPSTPHSSPTSSSTTLVVPPPRWKWYGVHPSLAYLANSIQLFGATVFFISVTCGLPGVLPKGGNVGGEEGRSSEGVWVGLYWGTQVLGAPCFVISAGLFCLEVQEKWWKPTPQSIGWQIGFWNVIGGLGFLFCGIFGIWRQTSIADPELYQRWGTAFSTFWGSWAFLLGSYIQLWEGINKRV